MCECEIIDSPFDPTKTEIISNNSIKILKVIMFDNLMYTRFKLTFLISLTLEIIFLHFLLCLEFSGGE